MTARTAGYVAGIDPFDLETNATARFTYVLARSLTVLFGTLTIWLCYKIGVLFRGTGTGLLAAGLLALSPGHIQNCHYYTVDVQFSFWVIAGIFLAIQMPSGKTWTYVAFGVVCGLATGTRWAGILLGLPFLLAHLDLDASSWKKRISVIWCHRTAVFFGSALITMLICEPYVLLEPGRYFGSNTSQLVLLAIRIVKGDFDYVFMLYDYSTIPYLYQLTHLFRYALGLPLELAAFCGLAMSVWRRKKVGLVMVGWWLPFFLVVGSLHHKPIRFTLSLWPLMAVLGAWACVEATHWLRHRSRRVPIYALPILLVGIPTLLLGLSIIRVYAYEDSRIEAARWIQGHIPQGEGVLTERGGFPTSWMVSEEAYRRVVDDASYYITYDATMLYSKKINFLQEKLSAVGWIVIIEENRMRQFTKVPDRYPIASEFYSRLASGDLGFEKVAEFKVQPGIGSWQYSEHDAEPTITAFDHPRVLIYHLRPDADVDGTLTEWAERTQSNKQLPDYYIGTGLASYRSGNWQGAAAEFEQIQRDRFVLGNLLLRAAHIRLGDHGAARVEWEKAMAFPSTDLIRAGSTLSTLGMEPEGVEFLRYTAANLPKDRSPLQFVAPYTRQGIDLIDRGEYVEAVTALAWASEFDSTRANTWYLLAEAYRKGGGLDQAEDSICTALDLDPSDTGYQTLLVNLGSDHYQQGNLEKAIAVFRKALQYNPQIAEAYLNLGVLYFSQSRIPLALEALKSAAGVSPDDLEILLSLGAVYLQSGQRDNATAVFSRVLDLDAENTQARAALDALAEN